MDDNEKRSIIDNNMDNFKELIYSTKTKHTLLNILNWETDNKNKIRGYGFTFDENRERVWMVDFSINPSKLDLPKEYLGIPIEYRQVIKSEFL
jgi:hypothetical protein